MNLNYISVIRISQLKDNYSYIIKDNKKNLAIIIDPAESASLINYIDKNKINTIKTYALYVRKLELGIKTHVNPAGELLWKEGLYKGHKPLFKSGLRTVESKILFNFVSEIIKSGKAENILYKVN